MKKALLLIISVILYTSCGIDEIKDPDPKRYKGKLSLESIVNDGSYNVSSTRGGEDDVNIDDFLVSIVNSDNEILNTYVYSDIKNKVLEFPVDQYTITATSPDIQPVAFEQPIFSGNKTLNIEESKINSVNIVCSIINMKVSVIFDNSFKTDLKDYEVIVSSDDGFLLFDDQNEGKAGFFDIKPLNVQVKAKRQSDNYKIEQSFVISEVAAKDHHIIILSTAAKGSGDITISIDYELNEKPIEIEIDDDNQEVVDPGPGPGPDPSGGEITISGPGIDEPLTLTDMEALDAVVDIDIAASEGIDQLYVRIDSPSLSEALLAAVGIPMEFDLANLDQYLTEYPNIYDFIEGELGLISRDDPIKGKEAFTVSIGAFMALLPADDDGSALTHKFHVRVVDGEGTEKSITLVVIRIEE